MPLEISNTNRDTHNMGLGTVRAFWIIAFLGSCSIIDTSRHRPEVGSQQNDASRDASGNAPDAVLDGDADASATSDASLTGDASATGDASVTTDASVVDSAEPLVDGSRCEANAQCASQQCVDGFCCNSPCSGSCEACAQALTDLPDGICGAIPSREDPSDECTQDTCAPGYCDGSRACAISPAGMECRASSGSCDVPEVCDGIATSCGADRVASANFVCRASVGPCDVEDRCTGTDTLCPGDTVSAPGVVCRGAAGVCDAVETCTGTSPVCPTDGFSSSTVVCRAANGVCDVPDHCSGTSSSCGNDERAAAGQICRPAIGPCDVDDVCDGSSALCGTDSFASSAVVCRPAVSVCDVADRCSGSSPTCTADVAANVYQVCRPSTSGCDLSEFCQQNNPNCPVDSFRPASSPGPCYPYLCSGVSALCTNSCTNPSNCSGSASCTGSMCVGRTTWYTSTNSASSFTSICPSQGGSGTAVVLDNYDDGISTEVALGTFSFPFFGVPKTHFLISSNGYITFDRSVTDACYNRSLCDERGDVIAPFWTDLLVSPGSVCRQRSGTRYTVEWRGTLFGDETQQVVFQLVMNTNGVIELIWAPQHTALLDTRENFEGIINFDSAIPLTAPGVPPFAGRKVTFTPQ